MESTKIYNLSIYPQNVKIGSRIITINSGNEAWFPRPQNSIFIETSSGTVYFPTSAESIYFTDGKVGTNLTMKYRKIENKSTYMIMAKEEKSNVYYSISPNTNIAVLFSLGDKWVITDPITKKVLGKIKINQIPESIIFNGEQVY